MKTNLKKILSSGDALTLHLSVQGGKTYTFTTDLETVIDEDRLVVKTKDIQVIDLLNTKDPVTLSTTKDNTGILDMSGHIQTIDAQSNQFIMVINISSAIKQTQRREYYRLPLLKEINLGLIGDPGMTAVTQNISAGGMRCLVPHRIRTGAKIAITMQLDQVTFSLTGRVLESQPVEGKNYHMVRVQFDHLDEVDRKNLVAYIINKQSRSR